MECTYTVSSLYDHSKRFTLHVIHPFTHIHTVMAGATTLDANLLIRGEFNHSLSFIHRWHREQFGVKCLAQGHTDMWTGGDGNQTPNLPIGGRLALPPVEMKLAKKGLTQNRVTCFSDIQFNVKCDRKQTADLVAFMLEKCLK